MHANNSGLIKRKHMKLLTFDAVSDPPVKTSDN